MTLFEGSADEPVRRLSLVKLSGEIARSAAAIGRVAVEGEVHRAVTRGGRTWFTLKDRAAQLSVTVAGRHARRARTVDGERVLVTGRLAWTPDRGQLQLDADEVVPVGAGAVAAMVAEARTRLARDGLLDRPRRALPRLPRAVGVVCGAEAAVRADIEAVVAGRFPGYPVRFVEVTVSGPGAVDAIVGGLRTLDADPSVDVIVLARGGGDATQLLPFSDEDLCRAVCACATPVVSAVGHEGDRPLCDEVADHRFGTPSIAAAHVVPDREALHAEIDRLLDAAAAAARRRVDVATGRLASIDRHAAARAAAAGAAVRLAAVRGRVELVHPGRRVTDASARLEAAWREAAALHPDAVLARGYAVVRDGTGRVVRDASALSPGDALDVRFAVGGVRAGVSEVRP